MQVPTSLRFLASFALLLVISGSPAAAQTLRIYQIDVEQADATLLVLPNSKTLLIDSGNNGDGRKIRNVMLQAGVDKADHHGSNTRSSAALLADPHPALALISNGSDGGYKRPSTVTLTAYGRLSPPPMVLQTNTWFQAAPCSNVSDAFIADPETREEDGTIEIDVGAPTATCTARYGTTTLMFAIKAPAQRVGAPNIVITSLLPNPVRADTDAETVTNKGSAAMPLVG